MNKIKDHKITKTSIRVDVFSDVVCPWCYIGWKRLEDAAHTHQGVSLDIHWRAFLLNPGMPVEGMDRQAYIQAKFGQAGDSFYARIAEVGRQVGIAFDFPAIQRTPDSRPAHYLIKAAGDHGHTIKLIMLADYFEHGVNIGASEYLDHLAKRFDITKAQLETGKSMTEADLEDGSMMDIHGVPHIIVDQRWAVSGAQPAHTFMPLFDAVIASRQG